MRLFLHKHHSQIKITVTKRQLLLFYHYFIYLSSFSLEASLFPLSLEASFLPFLVLIALIKEDRAPIIGIQDHHTL